MFYTFLLYILNSDLVSTFKERKETSSYSSNDLGIQVDAPLNQSSLVALVEAS